MENDSLQSYYDRLAAADWSYEFSDDPSAYRKGRDQIAQLCSEAGRSEAHMELFKHMEHWGRNGGEKPTAPK